MPVHHVKMQHSTAAINRGERFRSELREIGGQNRGYKFNQRVAPGVLFDYTRCPSARGQDLTQRTAGGTEVAEKNGAYIADFVAGCHGIVHRRALLSRPSSRTRITLRACSGVTASSARPSSASRILA